MIFTLVTKSTRNLLNLNCPIGPNQHESQILFDEKSSPENFIGRTLELYIGEWKKTVVGENKANSRDSFWLFCQFTVATATSRRFVARFSANKTIKKAQHRVECFAQCTKTNLFWIYIPAGWKCYARHRKARRRTFFSENITVVWSAYHWEEKQQLPVVFVVLFPPIKP